jgi:GDP/UDP-N,N'-diacetylbacillosamine 2-epimerase (hydrolysing)
MAKRRVAVVTGTRAEYGLLVPVMGAIQRRRELELQVVVTGMHLLRRFGYTVREIETDGWPIGAKVRLQGEKDDVIGQSRGLGRAITGMTEAFAALKTEIVLVLGDRIETFAAAAAATASQLVLGHIHGGDAAMGIQDDAYRHAITKLAHLHFAASAGSKKRLERLGEESFRIYQTGAPGLDDLSGKICKNIVELNRWAGFDVREDFLLVIQHPGGGTAAVEERRMRGTLEACRCKGLKTLVLYPNCDSGFSGVIKAAEEICSRQGFGLLRHIPRNVYLGLLGRARILVGNSSSGIIEAGSLNVDVINVGPRQAGRERGSNVLDCGYGRAEVSRAIAAVLRRGRKRNGRTCRIYGDGRSGERIARVLARVSLTERLRRKRIAY